MGMAVVPTWTGTSSANRATWANATMPKSEAATLQKAGLDIHFSGLNKARFCGLTLEGEPRSGFGLNELSGVSRDIDDRGLHDRNRLTAGALLADHLTLAHR